MIEKKCKTIFVSHPIRHEDAEIEQMRTNARRAVEKAYNVKDTSIVDLDIDDFQVLSGNKLYDDIYILKRAIDLLWISDVAYFPIGWDNYKICKVIHYICDTYKFPYIHVKDGHTSYHLFDKENVK